MLSLDEALARLLDGSRPTEPETVALADAVGRVLVEPRVIASIDVPPFANSAMDGFAVRAADAPGPLRLAGEVAAGAAKPEVVAENPPLGERVAATPAIADDTLYVRTAGHLYAFTTKK